MMVWLDSHDLARLLHDNVHLRAQVTTLQGDMTRMVEERRESRRERERLRGELDTAWASGYGPGGVVRVVGKGGTAK